MCSRFSSPKFGFSSLVDGALALSVLEQNVPQAHLALASGNPSDPSDPPGSVLPSWPACGRVHLLSWKSRFVKTKQTNGPELPVKENDDGAQAKLPHLARKPAQPARWKSVARPTWPNHCTAASTSAPAAIRARGAQRLKSILQFVHFLKSRVQSQGRLREGLGNCGDCDAFADSAIQCSTPRTLEVRKCWGVNPRSGHKRDTQVLLLQMKHLRSCFLQSDGK